MQFEYMRTWMRRYKFHLTIVQIEHQIIMVESFLRDHANGVRQGKFHALRT